MTDMLYILDGKTPRRATNLDDWANWMQKADRRVALTEFDGVKISTVFLGVDHGFLGRPILFESMIFGGPHDGETDRYSTWEQAERGHAAMVDLARKS